MSIVRVAAFSISLDGFGAGPRQNLQNPLGVRGTELHGWFFHTDAFKKIHGQGDGEKGIDNDFAAQSFENVGASERLVGRILRTTFPCLCSLITRGLPS